MDDGSKTWAEHIRNIKHDKVTLPWDAAKVVQQPRMTTFDKTREERQFDPVLQRFRDTRIETTRRQAETAYRTEVLNRSRVREVKYGQPYNILQPTPVIKPTFKETKQLISTLSAPVKEKIKEQNHAKRMRASRVDYNILSNMSTQEHHYAPPDQRPAPLPPPRHGSGPGKPTVESSATMKRDYNIISGRYRNHHSKRVDLDNKNLANTAAERFWQTHDFNPVTTTFYDGDKEELFKEARGVFEKSHGAVQRRRLPPKVRDSEGYLYDIVSMRTKDEEGLEALKMSQSGGENKLSKSVVEEKIRRRQNDRYDLVEQRKMNRVAARRFDEMTKHGYDLVTGQPYKGKGAKVVPRPVHMSRAPSVWKRAELAGDRTTKVRQQLGEMSNRGRPQQQQRSASATPVLRPEQPTTNSARSSGGGGGTLGASVFNDTMDGPETALGSLLASTNDDSKGIVPKLDMSRTGGSSARNKVRTGGF